MHHLFVKVSKCSIMVGELKFLGEVDYPTRGKSNKGEDEGHHIVGDTTKP